MYSFWESAPSVKHFSVLYTKIKTISNPTSVWWSSNELITINPTQRKNYISFCLLLFLWDLKKNAPSIPKLYTTKITFHPKSSHQIVDACRFSEKFCLEFNAVAVGFYKYNCLLMSFFRINSKIMLHWIKLLRTVLHSCGPKRERRKKEAGKYIRKRELICNSKYFFV